MLSDQLIIDIPAPVPSHEAGAARAYSYDQGVAELRQFLMLRIDLTLRNLRNVDADSEYAKEQQRLLRTYNALLRTFSSAVIFERELKGYSDGRQRQ